MDTSASEARNGCAAAGSFSRPLSSWYGNPAWVLDLAATFNEILALFSLWYLLSRERNGTGFTAADYPKRSL
jgi:hypothetical protein